MVLYDFGTSDVLDVFLFLISLILNLEEGHLSYNVSSVTRSFSVTILMYSVIIYIGLLNLIYSVVKLVFFLTILSYFTLGDH